MHPEEVKIKEVQPAYIPVMCPVCRGHKTVNWGKEPCTVCNQLGYIKVPPKEGEAYGYKR